MYMRSVASLFEVLPKLCPEDDDDAASARAQLASKLSGRKELAMSPESPEGCVLTITPLCLVLDRPSTKWHHCLVSSFGSCTRGGFPTKTGRMTGKRVLHMHGSFTSVLCSGLLGHVLRFFSGPVVFACPCFAQQGSNVSSCFQEQVQGRHNIWRCTALHRQPWEHGQSCNPLENLKPQILDDYSDYSTPSPSLLPTYDHQCT